MIDFVFQIRQLQLSFLLQINHSKSSSVDLIAGHQKDLIRGRNSHETWKNSFPQLLKVGTTQNFFKVHQLKHFTVSPIMHAKLAGLNYVKTPIKLSRNLIDNAVAKFAMRHKP